MNGKSNFYGKLAPTVRLNASIGSNVRYLVLVFQGIALVALKLVPSIAAIWNANGLGYKSCKSLLMALGLNTDDVFVLYKVFMNLV